MLKKKYFFGIIFVLAMNFTCSNGMPGDFTGDEDVSGVPGMFDDVDLSCLSGAMKSLSLAGKWGGQKSRELMGWVRVQKEFAVNGWRDRKTVGTVFQCSSWVGQELAKYVVPGDTVLEAGAGVGNVTKEIIKKLGGAGHLTAVELKDAYFAVLLREIGEQENVTLVNGDILSVTSDPFSKIVSTLPFNAFDPKFVANVLIFFVNNIQDGGWVSFVEYPLTGYMKWITNAGWNQYCGVQEITGVFMSIFDGQTVRVARNMPPGIMIHHVQVNNENRQTFLDAAQQFIQKIEDSKKNV